MCLLKDLILNLFASSCWVFSVSFRLHQPLSVPTPSLYIQCEGKGVIVFSFLFSQAFPVCSSILCWEITLSLAKQPWQLLQPPMTWATGNRVWLCLLCRDICLSSHRGNSVSVSVVVWKCEIRSMSPLSMFRPLPGCLGCSRILTRKNQPFAFCKEAPLCRKLTIIPILNPLWIENLFWLT